MAIKPKSRAHENRLKSLESLAPFFQNHIKALREDWAAHDERIRSLEERVAKLERLPEQGPVALPPPRPSAYDLNKLASKSWWKPWR